MGLSTTSISNILFKKLYGKSSTNDNRSFYEEPFTGRNAIMLDQLWTESNLIPTTAPVSLVNHNDVDGVIQYKKDVSLTVVNGLTNAFYSAELIDAILFNTGDGSYNYILKNSLDQNIPFGLGDWLVDGSTGVLTFYGIVPPNMPPKITFYKYIGTKGEFVATVNLVSTLSDKNVIPVNTFGDNQSTGLTITDMPQNASYVQVFVNGILFEVGNGLTTKDCYFVDPLNLTVARSFSGLNKIQNGDILYWNYTPTGFNLTNTDTVTMIYNIE